MQAGIFLTTAQLPNSTEAEILDRAVSYTTAAEEYGFDSAWILEHHFTSYGLCPSSLMLASHLLGRTSRLRVGTAISIIPLEHPIKLAEQVALLDHLGDGRFIFGIGRGMFTRDFDVFGVEMAKTPDIMREWVKVMQQLWTGKTTQWSSPLVSFPPVRTRPQPRTSPNPPMYVICTSHDTIKWAAQNHLPMIMNYRISDERKIAQVELYRQEAVQAGWDDEPVDHAISCVASVADSRDEATAGIRPGLEWWVQQGLRDSGLAGASVDSYERYYDDIRETSEREGSAAAGLVEDILRLNPIGSPDDCVTRITELHKLTGVTNYIFGFEGHPTAEATLLSMRRFATEVLPAVRSGLQ